MKYQVKAQCRDGSVYYYEVPVDFMQANDVLEAEYGSDHPMYLRSSTVQEEWGTTEPIRFAVSNSMQDIIRNLNKGYHGTN